MNALLIAGSVLLLVSLLLAWLLVFVRLLNVEPLRRIFPSHDHLVRAHIDYILMALLLYAFHLLADELPIAFAAMMILGAAVNPFLFVVLATKDEPTPKPGALFTGVTMLSFVLATLGFGGAALWVAFA